MTWPSASLGSQWVALISNRGSRPSPSPFVVSPLKPARPHMDQFATQIATYNLRNFTSFFDSIHTSLAWAAEIQLVSQKGGATHRHKRSFPSPALSTNSEHPRTKTHTETCRCSHPVLFFTLPANRGSSAERKQTGIAWKEERRRRRLG